MYIRRKVFSRLEDENGEERYFSTTEFTYMTEAEEERYFAEKEKEEEDEKKAKRKKIAKKAAIGAGIAAGIAASAYGGSKLTQRYIGKKATALSDALASGNLDEAETQKANEQLRKLFRGERIAKKITDPVDAAGRGIAKGARAAGEGIKKGASAVAGGVKKGASTVGDAAKKTGKFVKETAEKAGRGVKETATKVKNKIKGKKGE